MTWVWITQVNWSEDASRVHLRDWEGRSSQVLFRDRNHIATDPWPLSNSCPPTLGSPVDQGSMAHRRRIISAHALQIHNSSAVNKKQKKNPKKPKTKQNKTLLLSQRESRVPPQWPMVSPHEISDSFTINISGLRFSHNEVAADLIQIYISGGLQIYI